MSFDFSLQPGKTPINRGRVNTGEPLVSVVTPFFNGGKYLRQLYQCIQNQTLPFFEWIIVNDGSTNAEDVSILNQTASLDPRIRVLHTDNHGGVAARNTAIKNSRTEIIVTLDQDDLAEPTYLEVMYSVLCFHPEAACCYTNSVGFQNQEYLWNRQFDIKLLCVNNYLNYSAAFRKSILEEVGLYSETGHDYYADWLLWLKLLSADRIPIKLGAFGFWYRRSDSGSLSKIKNDPQMLRESHRLIREAAKNVCVNIKAVEYPKPILPIGVDILNMSDWERPFYQRGQKRRVLLLLLSMESGDIHVDFEHIWNMCGRDCGIGVIVITPPGERLQQKRYERVAETFNLTEFLDISEWAEFVDYYIKSRGVDTVFSCASEYGRQLYPWLKKSFPAVEFIDRIPSPVNGTAPAESVYARFSADSGSVKERILVFIARYRAGRILIRTTRKLMKV